MTFPRYLIYNQKYTTIFYFFFKKNILKKFLREFKKLTNLKNIIALNYARAGLFLVINKIVKKNKKKIIICPFTIFDIINVVILAGAVPVFIDSKKNSPDITFESVKKNVTKETVAIIITHYHSANSDIEKIINFCKKKNVKVIEDCAIALSGKYFYSKKHVGSLSDFAIFSFGLFKSVSVFSGGCLYVKNKKIYKEMLNRTKKFKQVNFLRLLFSILLSLKFVISLNKVFFNIFTFKLIKFSQNYSIKTINNLLKNDPEPKIRSSLPDNYLSRPSNYQLFEFSKQLPFVEDFRLKRIQNVRLICKILSKNNKLILPKTTNEYADTFHSLPVIVLMKKKEDLYKFLLKNNYDIAKYYYRDCSNLEIFSEYFRPCKNISQYSSNVLCIPVYHSIPKDYLKRLARTINDFYKL